MRGYRPERYRAGNSLSLCINGSSKATLLPKGRNNDISEHQPYNKYRV